MFSLSSISGFFDAMFHRPEGEGGGARFAIMERYGPDKRRAIMRHRENNDVVGYEAGRHGRKDLDFNPRAMGVNQLAQETLPLLRRRVKWLVNNNPILAGACAVIVKNVVGTGIMPVPQTAWPELNKQIKALFADECTAVNGARGQSLAANQALFLREVFSGGECGVYLPIVDAWKDCPRGPAIELIEDARVDFTHDVVGRGGGKNSNRRVRQGVHFDEYARPVGYTVLEDDPADGGFFAGGMMPKRRTVSASDMTLAFIDRDVKQIRGVPWCVSVVATVRMEDSYQEAYLLLSRAAACVSLYLSGVKDMKVVEDAENGNYVDVEGNPIERLAPGTIGFLPEGVEPHLLTPQVDLDDLDKIEAMLIRKVCIGLDLAYSALSKDNGKATFSSERASQLDTRKTYKRWQSTLVWEQHTRPFYRRLIAWWIVSGKLKLNAEQRRAWNKDPRLLYRAEMLAPGWDWVNPDQESKADDLAIKTGIKSVVQVCAAQGRDWEKVAEEQLMVEAFMKRRREEMGLPTPTAGAPASESDETDDKGEPKGGDDDQGEDDGDGKKGNGKKRKEKNT